MKKYLFNFKSLFFICIIVFTLFMSIGYATVSNVRLGISGTVSTESFSKIAITNVEFIRDSGTLTTNNFSFTDTHIDFNLKYTVNSSNYERGFYSVYRVTIVNDTLADQVLSSNIIDFSYTPTSKDMSVSYDLDGISIGDIIPAKTTIQFNLTINLYPAEAGTYTVSVDDDVSFDADNSGLLIGSIPNDSIGDLRNNNLVCFTVTVINSYKVDKQFELLLGNNNFEIVNANGNDLGILSIEANSTSNYNFCIRIKDGVAFPTDTQKANIYLKPIDADKSSIGVVTLLVEDDPTIMDDEAPVVSNVTGTLLSPAISGSVGSILVKWEATDNVGIDHYVVEVYQNNTLINTYTTELDEFTINNLADGRYYFKVTAFDGSGNSSSSQNTLADYIWHFTVKYSLSNARSSGSNNDIVNYDDTYNVTLSGSGTRYDAPSTITVKMGGRTLTNGSDYQYSSSGQLSIPNVRGNLEISGSGRYTGCLVKGTKVLLADGSYKNIENIGYDDLVAVWNYDTGSITYEYPLWIENEHLASKYIRITFSDNTYLDVVSNHALYDTDINLFVNLDDIKVGTKVAKVSDGKLQSVTVKSIEEIEDEVTYYFVGTTTYYNIIANDLLTTDANTIISNLYGFEDDAKWPSTKQEIVSNPNNIIDYSYFEDVLPYYLYKGFRAGESGYLINNNVFNLDTFKQYIINLIINPEMLKEPIVINNNHYWMVTTDYDVVNDYNKNNYLYREGEDFILPKIDGVESWVLTSDNQVYYPGDKIKVIHGLHFIGNG